VVGSTHRTPWSWSRLLWHTKGIYYHWTNFRTRPSKTIRRNDPKRSHDKRRKDKQDDIGKCPTRPAHYPPTAQDKNRQKRQVILIEDKTFVVKNAALMAAILTAIPANALAQSACGGPRELTICEAELYDAGVTWEGRARETRIKLSGCVEKLKVRTSTIIRSLAIPPAPELRATWKHDAILMGLAGASGLGFGVIIGILLIR